MQRRNSFPIFIIFAIFCVVLLILSSVFRVSFPGFLDTLVLNIQKSVLPIQQRQTEKNPTEEIQTLAKKIKDQQVLERENKALRDQFQTTTISSVNLLAAKVVGAPGFIPGISLPEFLILDKGSDEGVSVSQPVVYKDNLIGIIETVSKHASRVVLISSKQFSTTARIPKKDAFISGVAKGQGSGHIILDNVLLSEKIENGSIVTTGAEQELDGSGIPPDLVIGKVYSVEKKPSALFQTASLQSLIDPIQLSMVFVVTKK